jgi:hypothetical protein
VGGLDQGRLATLSPFLGGRGRLNLVRGEDARLSRGRCLVGLSPLGGVARRRPEMSPSLCRAVRTGDRGVGCLADAVRQSLSRDRITRRRAPPSRLLMRPAVPLRRFGCRVVIRMLDRDLAVGRDPIRDRAIRRSPGKYRVAALNRG